jgi:hypothetical protein
MKLAYSLVEAAEVASVSEKTLRRAINATDPKAFPPPLRAKRMGTAGPQRILHADLEAWLEKWPAA